MLNSGCMMVWHSRSNHNRRHDPTLRHCLQFIVTQDSQWVLGRSNKNGYQYAAGNFRSHCKNLQLGFGVYRKSVLCFSWFLTLKIGEYFCIQIIFLKRGLTHMFLYVISYSLGPYIFCIFPLYLKVISTVTVFKTLSPILLPYS